MPYYTGLVQIVPRKSASSDRADQAWPMLIQHGALRVVNTDGAEVPEGEQDAIRVELNAADDAALAFSWIEWPDRQTAEDGWKAAKARASACAASSASLREALVLWGGFTKLLARDLRT